MNRSNGLVWAMIKSVYELPDQRLKASARRRMFEDARRRQIIQTTM